MMGERSPKTTEVDLGRAARAARRANPDWSMERSLGVPRRFVEAVVEHTRDGYGGLAELHALVELRDGIDSAIDHVARHLLEHDDASYREVGLAVGVTAQAVAKRYPNSSSRQRGAQPGNLR
jgi:hypothetical protein